jgi:phage terminase large subunit-like protein
MYKKAEADITGRWAAFHFTSYDNPYISKAALDDLASDMTSLSYRMEIMAEDLDAAPGALWHREIIDRDRVVSHPDLERVVVAVDPSATSGGDEAGVITVGRRGDDYFTLADDSVQGSPVTWATAAVTAYHRAKADCIIGEGNNGGEMIEAVIKQVDQTVNYRMVHATRGKATRAEPIAAIHEQGHDHHVGVFARLEDELCLWQPGDKSPNRLDAKVWAMTELSKNIAMDSSWTAELGTVEDFKSPWA